ncbi:hypothetical protein GGR57DRAFT_77953 [Xylariaceae sp. FL1272]|nr:hypothetical protein GGR57DRAFT_77953 [Xylariaceae sp. FL1272]
MLSKMKGKANMRAKALGLTINTNIGPTASNNSNSAKHSPKQLSALLSKNWRSDRQNQDDSSENLPLPRRDFSGDTEPFPASAPHAKLKFDEDEIKIRPQRDSSAYEEPGTRVRYRDREEAIGETMSSAPATKTKFSEEESLSPGYVNLKSMSRDEGDITAKYDEYIRRQMFLCQASPVEFGKGQKQPAVYPLAKVLPIHDVIASAPATKTTFFNSDDEYYNPPLTAGLCGFEEAKRSQMDDMVSPRSETFDKEGLESNRSRSSPSDESLLSVEEKELIKARYQLERLEKFDRMLNKLQDTTRQTLRQPLGDVKQKFASRKVKRTPDSPKQPLSPIVESNATTAFTGAADDHADDEDTEITSKKERSGSTDSGISGCIPSKHEKKSSESILNPQAIEFHLEKPSPVVVTSEAAKTISTAAPAMQATTETDSAAFANQLCIPFNPIDNRARVEAFPYNQFDSPQKVNLNVPFRGPGLPLGNFNPGHQHELRHETRKIPETEGSKIPDIQGAPTAERAQMEYLTAKILQLEMKMAQQDAIHAAEKAVVSQGGPPNRMHGWTDPRQPAGSLNIMPPMPFAGNGSMNHPIAPGGPSNMMAPPMAPLPPSGPPPPYSMPPMNPMGPPAFGHNGLMMPGNGMHAGPGGVATNPGGFGNGAPIPGPPMPGQNAWVKNTFGPKPVQKPKGPFRPGDMAQANKQQAYEEYLEYQRQSNPEYALKCRQRQARRAERQIRSSANNAPAGPY